MADDPPADDLYATDLGNFDRPEFVRSNPMNESEFEDPRPAPRPVIPPPENEITYRVVNNGSDMGKDILIDSLGYQYTVKIDNRRPTKTWRCSRRSKALTCTATVLERGGNYIRAGHDHICGGAQPGREKVAIIRREVKAQAVKRPFESAAQITEEVMMEHMHPDEAALHPTMPGPLYIAKAGNRKRQGTRPRHPDGLHFDVNEDHIPDSFLRKDVRIGDRRHLIFATDTMLRHLSQCRVWYVDATYKVVRAPFSQLFSVHAFIKSGTSTKQIPLAFVLMSARNATDYTGVLRAIMELLPGPPSVTRVMTDYEPATWQALRAVFPGVEVKGCLFHFTQAVFRKVQSLGLQHAYSNDPGTHAVCRDLMSLPLLPQEHVAAVFARISAKITDATPALRQLATYVDNQWVGGNIFKPESWSVFQQKIRTNNDVEGWHCRLNHRGQKANLPFYLLVELLRKESTLVSFAVQFVYQEEQLRRHRAGSANINSRLTTLWQEYAAGDRSARSLLSAGSHYICPRPKQHDDDVFQ
ncbi:hypothetical protein GWK47_050452 [Chionoecetes opilio]|uniref:MULE transposase domain-containing protein n=1 Tax=Chionoecetes opilio TaxID=41210 RepID=A0A8J4Y1J7_CHIOP|nr:hypothetical protein GWK47_050452 [Chionoecetes opilio]